MTISPGRQGSGASKNYVEWLAEKNAGQTYESASSRPES
jgi:hypothetical protein